MFPEKVSDALAAQRFQIFEDLAKDLAGEVLFPTCFDLVINLRNLLKDPDVSIERVTAAVRADPLISSKLIELANSAAYADKPVLKEVRGAVERLGLNTVRLTSLAIAQHQMLQLTDIVEQIKDITEQFEESHELGRFIDVDVTDNSGVPVSSGKSKVCFYCKSFLILN